MLPGKMSPWQLASVKDIPRSLPLRFGQNRVSNSWDIVFLVVVFFCQNPNLTSTQPLGFTRKWLCNHHHYTNSMSAISQLLLTRFWPNFKLRFLGTTRTDFNCHIDICPCNICPGNICPYQEYLGCYWLNFDQTLKVYSKKNVDFNSFEPDHFTKKKFNQNLLDP